MNDAECLARRYLRDLGRGTPVHEPDGNVPPDFSLPGGVAVEVRRLNQNHQNADGSTEGLEEFAIPLWQRLKRLLPGLGPSVAGESWFVGMDFRRPVGTWKPLREGIERELLAFMNTPHRERCTLAISKNFELDLMRAGGDYGSFFLLGASSDDDSGGWVMGEVERNLRICIAEKERKIAPYRDRYAEWWLVLSDHIDFGMDSEDHETFRTVVMPRLPHSFDRIVLLDPRNHRRALEI
jgi:hypothetical protein